MRVREEGHFHTPEQVTQHVAQVLDIADGLELNGDDRVALLPAMLALVAGKQVVFEAGAAAVVTVPPEHLR